MEVFGFLMLSRMVSGPQINLYLHGTTRAGCVAGGERVGDLSVAPGGRDAAWTRAMKLLLTDLKWLLAWSSRLPE